MVTQNRASRNYPCGGKRLHPCPHLTCRMHLYTDMKKLGGSPVAKLRTQKRPLEALPVTCALAVAEACPGGVKLDVVAELLGLGSRERARQIQEDAILHFAQLSGDTFDPEGRRKVLQRTCPGCGRRWWGKNRQCSKCTNKAANARRQTCK